MNSVVHTGVKSAGMREKDQPLAAVVLELSLAVRGARAEGRCRFVETREIELRCIFHGDAPLMRTADETLDVSNVQRQTIQINDFRFVLLSYANFKG
jgi:hypothetical protein